MDISKQLELFRQETHACFLDGVEEKLEVLLGGSGQRLALGEGP